MAVHSLSVIVIELKEDTATISRTISKITVLKTMLYS